MLRHCERGQSIPFWTFATVGLLALLLFVFDYALSVVWNVRAQNAADSAASAGLSVQANILNEESTILYATSLDEYRLRALNQAILNTINHNGGCTAGSTGTCASDYAVLVGAYNNVLATYKKDVQLIAQADNFTQGGQLAAEARAATNSFGSVDPNFSYTSTATQTKGGNNHFAGNPTIEVIACRNVSYVGGSILGASKLSFEAIGHGSASVSTALSENFSPAATNPATGASYQTSPETSWFGTSLPFKSADYEVSYGTAAAPSLTVNLNWYTAVPVHGTTTFAAKDFTCQ